MALGIKFVCGNCHFEIEAWDEGNPHFIDEAGKKHYAYHPDHDSLARCIGNDLPFLCLDCGNRFKNDSRKPKKKYPKCKSIEIIDEYCLDGKYAVIILPSLRLAQYEIAEMNVCLSVILSL